MLRACVKMHPAISQKQECVLLQCRISPKSKRNSIRRLCDDALLISLKAPPVDGKANEELVKFLSKLFDLRRSEITIERGHTSKNKLIKLSGISKEEVINRIKTFLKNHSDVN